MALEHEIPEGSKLYFGRSAAAKRAIESVAARMLDEAGFEEIAVPLFSYHQHLSIFDERELIRLGDNHNNAMSIRADSTIDVVRIVYKRLGLEHSKWFYIQPIYRYPALEQYQIGAEILGEKALSVALNHATRILQALDVAPLLQLSNINIPHLLCTMFDLTLDDFRQGNIEKFLALKSEWLERLVYLQHVDEIDGVLSLAPEVIAQELIKIKELHAQLEYPHVVIAPLYYAKMLYYDELFFRFIQDNSVVAMGGRYHDEERISVGFAIYTDTLIELKHTRQ